MKVTIKCDSPVKQDRKSKSMNEIDNNNQLSLPIKNGFRLRGVDITRLETFTDAAFAFAVTMLVIAGDSIPTNYQALVDSLKDIPAFAAGIAMLLFIWYGHLQWSRRYGLEDGPSIVLSGALVLSILVFVYPLKLVFAAMFAFFSGGILQSAFVVTTPQEMIGLFIFYGCGLTITCWNIALLFYYALTQRELLSLNEREIFETKATIASWMLVSLPAFASAIAAWLLPANFAIWSGFLYWLYPILTPLFARKIDAKRKRIFCSDDIE
jgi:hypothetical protein